VIKLLCRIVLDQCRLIVLDCSLQLFLERIDYPIPNSLDGWWTYEMHMPPLPQELQYQSSWDSIATKTQMPL
jgi:hypothetical protein